MKLAYIIPDIDYPGGTEKALFLLVSSLLKEHEISIFSSSMRQEFLDKVEFHKIPMINYPPLLTYFTFFFWNHFLFGIRKIFKMDDFDIIAATGADSLFADVTTIQICVAARADLVRRGILKLSEKGLLKRIHFHLFHALVGQMEKLVFSRKKLRFIAVSEGVKRDIVQFYGISPDKINVIPNPADVNTFTPNNRLLFRESIRKKHGLSENETVLLYVGSEFAIKGLHLVIEAMPLIKDSVKVLVVGRGQFEFHRKLATELGVIDRVIFAGFSSDVKQYYAAGDIFVYPTYYEAFALVTLEAASSGLPIVASKVNGTEELIVNGHNGFFVKHDAKDIAEKVNLLIEDEELRKQMSINIRKSAEQFSPEEMARKTMQVYESVLKGK